MLFVSALGGWYYGPLYLREGGWPWSELDLRYQWLGRLRVGLRFRHFEADVQAELSRYRWIDQDSVEPLTLVRDRLWMAFQVGLAGYSYRHSRFRIRHGFHAGSCLRVRSRCRCTPADCPSECTKEERDNTRPQNALLCLEVHPIDVAVRLFDGLWLEISPLNLGFPKVYTVSVGLRWEGLRLWTERGRRPGTGGEPESVQKRVRSAPVFFFSALGGWDYSFWHFVGSESGTGDLLADSRYTWFVGVRAGVRWKKLEGDVQVDLSTVRWTEWSGDDPEVTHDRLLVGLQFGFSAYSYRHPRFRIRHGVHLGLAYPLMLEVDGHFADLLIRLHGGLWLEISPFNFGIHRVYSVSAGLRWESGR